MLRTARPSSQTLKLLNILESKFPDFYLAEGTALAMYCEPRVSYYLDFFTAESFRPVVMLGYLKRLGVSVENVRIQTGTTIRNLVLIILGMEFLFAEGKCRTPLHSVHVS
jgi:hypothetical protein